MRTIGGMQATAVLHLLVSVWSHLYSRVLLYDARDGSRVVDKPWHFVIDSLPLNPMHLGLFVY
ncbi:MAG: hypothetical protein EVA60_01010 [Litorivicinaceae bacterium]|nr:MAG: hypothetical protein EVA60_01010 [Litorivicinaceae bacterium]|tara:strand:+ start:9478 stop:9666 length:189 start_codon:yes stop_codon:yes gene_type:complete